MSSWDNEIVDDECGSGDGEVGDDECSDEFPDEEEVWGVARESRILRRREMPETKVYNNDFSGPQDVIDGFGAPDDALLDATVFYASYTYEDYSGYAVVVFEKDGKLWEVHGSHCSCFGLEGQWEPEETSWGAIAMRPDHQLVDMAKAKLTNSKQVGG